MIGVLVSGEGTNLQAILDARLPVSAVASSRREARALERAEAAGVPARAFDLETFASREERDIAMADWLKERAVTLVACAGFMQLLTPSFLERFPQRIVNIHPSLLPAFPGTTPIEDALAAGVAETGVTVHWVDEGVDSGPVIAQERARIIPGETAVELRQRLHDVEHRLYPRVLRELVDA
ncbi:MAG TPA: phosphoribosylglycinamide formyltransferase [Gaiellaceae bacterium]|nr:phosphoribosylglycinamide formyltransferase [Gaiellaceae bacterium]